jgi:dimethylglycine dehydrogenase
MKTHARVVVIGGGVAGCALLYHLSRLGWTDSVLVEKGELTVGSTWHAAGNTPHYATGWTLGRIYLESTNFYQAFAKETGEDVGFHKCGGVRLSVSKDHEEEHRRAAAKARAQGMRMEIIGPNQAKDLLPYMNIDGIRSVCWTPDDGYIDPSSITNALARQARAKGAEIYRHTRVTGLKRANGHWRVETEKGTITSEIVVNAAGLWAREVSAMVGHHVPVVPMERQYLVTETVPGIRDLKQELPILRDISAPLYMRQEQQSLLLGLFDKEPVFWSADGTPPGFEQELLVPDLERVSHAFERALERVPVLGELGVKRVVNGPLMRTPDGNPLIGPVPGLDGYWMNGGYFAGFGLAGALTSHLAEWMIEGEPQIDLSGFDLRRYGDYATGAYTMESTRAAYVHEFSVAYPNEEHPAAREVRTTPLYGLQKQNGAVFGARNGWEVPLWWAPAGVIPEDEPAYGRANWFSYVAQEAHAVANAAGLMDLSSLAKFEVSGASAATWLDSLCTGRLPDVGRVAPSLILTAKGGVAAFVALMRLAEDRFLVTASALLEQHLDDLLKCGAPADVRVVNETAARGTLLLAGPKAREILQATTRADLSDAKLPRGGMASVNIGIVPATVARLSEVGSTGFEIHLGAPYLLAAYEAVKAAGAPHGLRDAGYRAFHALRIEMGMPAWGVDIGPTTSPKACGLDRFVDTDKAKFRGREAYMATAEPRDILVLLALDDGGPLKDVDPFGVEPVCIKEEIVGLTTSCAFGHRAGRRLALAFLKRELATKKTEVEIEVMGQRLKARPIDPPRGKRLG